MSFSYRKKREVSRGWFILISAFIIMLLNWNVLIQRFLLLERTNCFAKTALIFSEYLLGFIIVAIFLFIFIFSKFLLRFWVYFFIIMSAIFNFYMFYYKVFIDELMIGTIFETNIKEIEGVINLELLVWIIFFAIVPLFIISRIKMKRYSRYSDRFNLKTLKTGLILPIIILIFTYGLAVLLNPAIIKRDRVVKNTLASYTPFNYIAGFYQYFVLLKQSSNIVLEDISTKYKYSTSSDSIANKDVNIILIIGESARADHQSLNGYKRETNPNLSKIKNLTSFTNVVSCGTLSRISVNCILSYKNRTEFEFPIKENNIISIFNKLNFETAFLSTQTMYDTGVDSFYLAAKDANKIAFSNSIRERIPSGESLYDEYLLSFINDIKASPNKKRFIVVYLTGSHTPYEKRYPKKFAKFLPDTNSGDKSRVNAYDNTILYTDYVISRIIDTFKNENSLVYYAADHGESLGENGRYLHGAPYDSAPREQVHIASFFWASDSMIKLLGNNYKNIIAKENASLSQDNIFPTLLDCIGVSSRIVDKNKSLCSNKIK